MLAFLRALRAERLKLRRSLALALTLLIPLAIVILQFCEILDQGPQAGLFAGDDEPLWQAHLNMVLNWWSLLILPLFATLATALIAAVDHSNNQWKQLYALPVPRGAIYAAKMAVGLGLVLLSIGAVLVYTLVSGALLNVIFPDTPLGWDIPWLDMVRLSAILFASSWLLVAIHTWVSMRWSSFVVPSAFGIVATMAGIIVIQSKYAPYYPWTLPTMALLTQIREAASRGVSLTSLLALGLLGGVVLWPLASWRVTRRDVL